MGLAPTTASSTSPPSQTITNGFLPPTTAPSCLDSAPVPSFRPSLSRSTPFSSHWDSRPPAASSWYKHSSSSSPDPNWDSKRGNGFHNVPSASGGYAQRRHPDCIEGTHWHQFITNPLAQNNVDLDAGTLAPWWATHPSCGCILNHPTAVMVLQLDQEFFLFKFNDCHGPYNTKVLKEFFGGFPSCPFDSDVTHLVIYHSTMVQYCSMFKIFAPPAHTLHSGNFLGIWYNDLIPDAQTSVATSFPQILSSALLGKKANLLSQSSFGEQLQHKNNGYIVLYRLALLGENPLLVTYPNIPSMPCMKDHDTICLYVHCWVHFLHFRLLNGVHLSGRYFLQEFMGGLHPFFHPICSHLTELIAPFNNAYSIMDLFPLLFSPIAFL